MLMQGEAVKSEQAILLRDSQPVKKMAPSNCPATCALTELNMKRTLLFLGTGKVPIEGGDLYRLVL